MKLSNGFKVSFVLATVMVSIAWAGTPYFENVAPTLGVANTGSGNGAAWLDYDNDGDLDLYFVNDPGSGGFYRNNLDETGNATFTGVSVGVTGNGGQLATADYDGDGYMDVLVGSSGNAILYRNKGDGSFEDVTGSSGISVTNFCWPIWGHYYDQDGKPDLYFGEAGRLYKNNGDGTFADKTSEAFPSSPPLAVAAWIDYDNDRYDDLFLAPASGSLILYHNKGDGTFEDVSTAAGIDLPSKDALIAVGDYDKNGFDDIYFFGGGGNNYLFSNNGNDTFTEVALAAGVQTTAGTGNYDVDFLDFDLDSDLDLFTNGGRYGSNNFFINNGDGTFTDITALTGLSNTDDTHDIAVGDFNGDGYPDIYEVNFTGYGSSANKLFLNTVPEPAEFVPDADTVALWHLNGNGEDASGNGNHLTVKTDRVSWVPGKYGQAALMGDDPWSGSCWNSDGGAITAPGSGCTYPGSGDWTVEAWVLFPSNSEGYMAACHYSKHWAGHDPYRLGISNGEAYFQLVDSSNNSINISGDISSHVGEWVHLAGVYRYQQDVALYVNGVRVAHDLTTLVPETLTNYDVFVGGSYCGTSTDLKVDEVRLSNVTRHVHCVEAIECLACWNNISQQWEGLHPSDKITSGNVHVITHGWGKGQLKWVEGKIMAAPTKLPKVWEMAESGNDYFDSFTNVAEAIANSYGQSVKHNILAYSWIHLSATPPLCELVWIPQIHCILHPEYPKQSKNRTGDAGRILKDALEQAGINSNCKLHLLGHSHGARVITLAAILLENAGVQVDHLTYWDSPERPYYWPFEIPHEEDEYKDAFNQLHELLCNPEKLGNLTIGTGTGDTFIDNYFASFGAPYCYPHMVDVSLMQEGQPTWHSHPIEWYASATENTQNGRKEGIWWSPLRGNLYESLLPQYGLRYPWAYYSELEPVDRFAIDCLCNGSVDDLVGVSVGRVGYDRRTRQFSVNATVTNTSAKVIGGPVWLVIESISSPNVTLAASDGTTADGKPYIDLSDVLDDGQLDPEESVNKRVYFNNPRRRRFTFKLSVCGVVLP